MTHVPRLLLSSVPCRHVTSIVSAYIRFEISIADEAAISELFNFHICILPFILIYEATGYFFIMTNINYYI